MADGSRQCLGKQGGRGKSGGAKFGDVRHGMFHVAGARGGMDDFRMRLREPPDGFRQLVDGDAPAGGHIENSRGG